MADEFPLIVKYGKDTLELRLPADATVAQLQVRAGCAPVARPCAANRRWSAAPPPLLLKTHPARPFTRNRC